MYFTSRDVVTKELKMSLYATCAIIVGVAALALFSDNTAFWYISLAVMPVHWYFVGRGRGLEEARKMYDPSFNCENTPETSSEVQDEACSNNWE